MPEENAIVEIQHLRELIIQRLDMSDRILKEKASDIQRRLEDLNNENRRVIEMQSTMVTRDVFDTQVNSVQQSVNTITSSMVRRDYYDTQHTILEDDVNALKRWRANIEGRMIIIIGLVGFIPFIVNLTVTIVIYFLLQR